MSRHLTTLIELFNRSTICTENIENRMHELEVYRSGNNRLKIPKNKNTDNTGKNQNLKSKKWEQSEIEKLLLCEVIPYRTYSSIINKLNYLQRKGIINREQKLEKLHIIKEKYDRLETGSN